MTGKQKKILIVTSEFPPQPGGIGNHAYNLAYNISMQGYDVSVIADQRSLTGDEEIEFDKGLPFKVIRIKRYSFRTRMYINRIVSTYRMMKNISFVIATGKFSLWNVGLLSKFSKAKTIAVIHGTEVNFKPFLLRKSVNVALKQFDEIVAVSNYTKELISSLNIGVHVIPNGIDIKDWEVESTNSKPLKGNPVLITVGRVSSRKGQLNVIKHLPKLTNEFPELHYHCIGIPTEADEFLKKAEKLNVDNYVTFHGSLDNEQLKQALSGADIFVMLSSESPTGDVEGFGIAILEANTLGIPAIGSKGCGIEDAIDQNSSGILVDHKDSLQFLQSVKHILENKNIFYKGAVSWSKQHDWSYIIKDYIKLLE